MDAGAAEDAGALANAGRDPPAAGAGTDNETKGIGMTTAAHTAGQWYVTGRRDINGKYLHIGCKSSMMVLASLNPVHIDTEANARLIAAAPELLKTLHELRTMCDPSMSHQEDLMARKIDAAIAKATGAAA